MFRIRLCNACQGYTLSESHHGTTTVSAHPARFNPNDPYGKYRRTARFGV
ncbi:RNA-protein complex protein Nop10 [Candidatus Micrarchaeota archaeon]|nr:RNA-protein complex protein Nop10 [Candidatus Micrarchaeota archaeon]